MTKLQSFFAVIAAAVCVGMLGGCSQGTSTSATGTGAGGGAKPGEDTLAKVKREGVLKWGADSNGGAPFVYGDGDKIIGFEIDMMEKIAGHMGVKQERVPGQWDSLLTDMDNNRSDCVMNGIEINDLRLQAYVFSQPYFIYEQQISVRAEDKDKYKSLADLKGKKIGVLKGTEAVNVLKRAGFTDDQMSGYDDSKSPYEDLNLKRTEAVLAEWMIADFYTGPTKGIVKGIYNNPNTFAPGKYGVAFRKGKENQALAAEMDRVLKLMKENGELAAIYKKWNIWNDKQKELGIVEK